MIQALTILAACINALALGRLTPDGGLVSLAGWPQAFHAMAALVFVTIAMGRALK